MATYLLSQKYKDPAAVIIGGLLEEQLRKLCLKNTLPTEITDANGNVRPKKADTMNSDLASAGVYSKIVLQQVTAWLGLRNPAAHGKYTEYDANQVERMLQGVRDFLGRYPA